MPVGIAGELGGVSRGVETKKRILERLGSNILFVYGRWSDFRFRFRFGSGFG